MRFAVVNIHAYLQLCGEPKTKCPILTFKPLSGGISTVDCLLLVWPNLPHGSVQFGRVQ